MNICFNLHNMTFLGTNLNVIVTYDGETWGRIALTKANNNLLSKQPDIYSLLISLISVEIAGIVHQMTRVKY